VARCHPTPQVPPGMADLVHYREELERYSFLGGASTKVVCYRTDEVVLAPQKGLLEFL
jgi:hypothetical protein